MLTEKKVLFGKYLINTKSAGKGNKIIFFVHGNSQNAGSWDLQMMDENLSSQYKLVSFDLPGHGDSDWFSDYTALYNPKEFSKVLETVLGAYDAEEFILVGLSYGTNIIAEITEPLINCKGIVLAGSCILSQEVTPAMVFKEINVPPVTLMPYPAEEDVIKFCSLISYSDISLRQTYIESFKKTDPVFREELGKTMVACDWGDEIQNIRNHKLLVLVIFGEEEALVHTNYLDNVVPAWNQKSYLINGAGHLVNQERPGEFNQLLYSFASEVLK